MKILVLGDSYCPVSALAPAFDRLADQAVTFRDLSDEPDWRPVSPSELRIKEYLGSPAQVIAALDHHDVIVVQGAPVTDAVLDAAPELRLICVARGGPVNVDVETATARGIPVVTTPGKNATAVAELAIAMMVMLARRIPECARQAEGTGDLYVDNYEGAAWFGQELEGKTLGIIGFGQIGQRVASRAKAMGMHVVAHDPFVDPAVIQEHGDRPLGLDDLLAIADHVSLHARATPANRGMLGAAQFARMKPGAFLINTARDVLLDEDALVEALASGHLGGAALDIASASPAGERHRLLATPNVVLLPHIGGATWETLTNGGRMAVAEIERFLKGEPFANLANPGVRAAAGARA